MSDFDLRLSALSKLIAVRSPAVDERLSQEYARVEQSLRNSSDYDELAQALKTLGVLVGRYHMAAAGLLGVTVPPENGGTGGSPELVRDCVAAVASGCGVTAFVYFQHVVGCRHLAS